MIDDIVFWTILIYGILCFLRKSVADFSGLFDKASFNSKVFLEIENFKNRKTLKWKIKNRKE